MITPNDIENLQFKKTAFGYSVDEVDDFLDKLALDYEKVFRDNVKLNSKVTMLEESLQRYDNMEETIKSSMLLAEKTAKDTRSNAKEQAENILDRAEMEAEKIIAKTYDKKAEIEEEISALKKDYRLIKAKLRMLLETELELLDEDDADLTAPEDEDEYDDEEEYEEPLTVPDRSAKRTEQERKLKVLGELFEN